jgi:hypothetical protein
MTATNADLLEEGVEMLSDPHAISPFYYFCKPCVFASKPHFEQSKVRYDARMHALSKTHQKKAGR